MKWKKFKEEKRREENRTRRKEIEVTMVTMILSCWNKKSSFGHRRISSHSSSSFSTTTIFSPLVRVTHAYRCLPAISIVLITWTLIKRGTHNRHVHCLNTLNNSHSDYHSLLFLSAFVHSPRREEQAILVQSISFFSRSSSPSLFSISHRCDSAIGRPRKNEWLPYKVQIRTLSVRSIIIHPQRLRAGNDWLTKGDETLSIESSSPPSVYIRPVNWETEFRLFWLIRNISLLYSFDSNRLDNHFFHR